MTDPITIARAQAAIENGLIEALQSQAQADMDGTTVIVSRQACDEAAEFLPALYDEVKRLRAALDEIATAASGIAHDLQIGPEDEGRDIYDMVLAIRDDASAALKGPEE